ncbi:MAG: hypothetical protein JKY34_13885 [Kordiimonadaceae bacterium]|nr:hypothetical protein [Kordiimonadaceae bacterium]
MPALASVPKIPKNKANTWVTFRAKGPVDSISIRSRPNPEASPRAAILMVGCALLCILPPEGLYHVDTILPTFVENALFFWCWAASG